MNPTIMNPRDSTTITVIMNARMQNTTVNMTVTMTVTTARATAVAVFVKRDVLKVFV
jgi:hypothetical protein